MKQYVLGLFMVTISSPIKATGQYRKAKREREWGRREKKKGWGGRAKSTLKDIVVQSCGLLETVKPQVPHSQLHPVFLLGLTVCKAVCPVQARLE